MEISMVEQMVVSKVHHLVDKKVDKLVEHLDVEMVEMKVEKWEI